MSRPLSFGTRLRNVQGPETLRAEVLARNSPFAERGADRLAPGIARAAPVRILVRLSIRPLSRSASRVGGQLGPARLGFVWRTGQPVQPGVVPDHGRDAPTRISRSDN